MSTQQAEATQRVRTFDENGNTVEDTEVQPEEVEPVAEPEVEAAPEPKAKYRIGDQEFDTQEEALAYANNQVVALSTEQQLADAYRQGLRDGIPNQAAPAQPVTPVTPEPKYNTDELYTNPESFLDKFAHRIKTETQSELSQQESMKRESDRIWREFTDRHPGLADFREDVEVFVTKNQSDVRAIISTKGQAPAYDYIATKLKARFEKYSQALKPSRSLPNGGTQTTTQQKGTTVTPNTTAKKPLSFAEQVRSIRKGQGR